MIWGLEQRRRGRYEWEKRFGACFHAFDWTGRLGNFSSSGSTVMVPSSSSSAPTALGPSEDMRKKGPGILNTATEEDEMDGDHEADVEHLRVAM
ncbi:hypothetical protein D9757_010593 [Collybiopsis confluens]|uniref:Uncharacterized protein n=1 Tax=Collybiopsis confluens TaxID=2823264 RepID=A0A8H5GVN6_9AGAR|nr:hypothetical protein D9757_010593 [Collybiopsis confluens]